MAIVALNELMYLLQIFHYRVFLKELKAQY